MFTVYSIHAPTAAKLSEVSAAMRLLGAPTIEVVDCGDYYMALEGSTRLAAAHDLGLTPSLVIRDQNDIIDITTYDWFEAQNWNGTKYQAGEVAGELYAPSQAVPYSFNHDHDPPMEI